jgi:hypothetical protein
MIRALKKASPDESRARKVTGLLASAYGSGIASPYYADYRAGNSATEPPASRALPGKQFTSARLLGDYLKEYVSLALP